MENGRDYEAEAVKDGWAPQEQWKGDPDKWKTAEQFVKDGENINGILKSRLDRQDNRINELLESNKALAKMGKKALEREKAEKEKLMEELSQARKQAIIDADGDAFEKADEALSSLRNAKEEVDETPPLAPVAQDWLKDNKWYGTNTHMSIQADGIADRLRAAGYDDTSQGYFEELTRQVKEAFPNEFENPARKRAGLTEEGGERGSEGSGKKTFDDLPADAKAQYEAFKRDIPGFTKEDYVAQYEWE